MVVNEQPLHASGISLHIPKYTRKTCLHTNTVTFIHVIMFETPPLQLVIDYFIFKCGLVMSI